MKFFKKSLLIFICTFLFCAPNQAFSAENNYLELMNELEGKGKTVEEPIIIVRFYHQDISFQTKLRAVVLKSLNQTPARSFEMVSVIPTTGDFQEAQENAQENPFESLGVYWPKK